MINKSELERIISTDDVNESMMELYEHISTLCALGENMEKINDSEKVVFYLMQLQFEADNGGFNQYFWNSSGDYAHETVAALKLIKATETAELLQNAIDLFPNKTIPKDIDARQEIMEEIDDELTEGLDPIDSDFNDQPDYLNDLCMDYIKENQDKFAH